MRGINIGGRVLAPMALAAVILTGCWDRREVNDIAIVTGSAMDKAGGKYRAAVQFPLAGQLGGPGGGGGGTAGEKSWYVDSGTGDTIKEANGLLQRSLSRQLYFAHRRVLIIGEELARSGISPVMDVTSRNAQNRMTAFIVFAKGEAVHLLNTDSVMEQQPSEMIRELNVNYMKKPVTLKRMLNILLSDGIDLAAPYLVTEKNRAGKTGEGKTTITVEGLAVFKKDKLVGFIKENDAKGVIWVMNEAKRPIITVSAPKGDGSISMQFSENHVELKPVFQGDKVEMRIRIRALGALFENESNYKASSDNLFGLQQAASAKLKDDVEKGIKQLQSYGSDACGFGDAIYRQKPGVWKKLKGNWGELYPKVKVTVAVELQLEHTGTLSEPAARQKETLIQ